MTECVIWYIYFHKNNKSIGANLKTGNSNLATL